MVAALLMTRKQLTMRASAPWAIHMQTCLPYDFGIVCNGFLVKIVIPIFVQLWHFLCVVWHFLCVVFVGVLLLPFLLLVLFFCLKSRVPIR